MKCSVFGCNLYNEKARKTFDENVMFFRFPKDYNLAKIWENACKVQGKINTSTARLCSKHFVESDYERNLREELLGYSTKNRRLLKKDAVPTKNLPHHHYLPCTSNFSSTSTPREKRTERREHKRVVNEILKQDVPVLKSKNFGWSNPSAYSAAKLIGIKNDQDELLKKVMERNVQLEKMYQTITSGVAIKNGRDDSEKVAKTIGARQAQLIREQKAIRKIFTTTQIEGGKRKSSEIEP